MEKPMVIILTGDMFSDADFKSILEDAIGDYLGWAPPNYSDDAMAVAAKGAAELRRRGKAPWSKQTSCILSDLFNNKQACEI